MRRVLILFTIFISLFACENAGSRDMVTVQRMKHLDKFFLRSRLFYLSLCCLLITGCSIKADVKYKTVLSEQEIFTESIPVRNSNIFFKSGEAWIAIECFKPKKMFLEDSFRRLMIFIYFNDTKTIDNKLIGDTSIYFVHGGVRTDTGRMKAKNLVLSQFNEGGYELSGTFESDTIYDDGGVLINALSAHLENIPLIKAEQKESLAGTEMIIHLKEQYNIVW